MDTHQTRRPVVVSILAVLQFIRAFGFGLIVVALLAAGPGAFDQLSGGAGNDLGVATDVAFAIGLIVLGGLSAASFVGGVLLVRMRQLGWTITMLMAGLGLAATIYLWWSQGATIAIWSVIEIATVFYLNQRQVRTAFRIAGRRSIVFSDGSGR
jgi:hypothetical protein